MKRLTNEQIRIWANKISQSDRKAFDSLFRAFYAPLVGFACRYTADKDEACDIVQEAFVKIWLKRHEIDARRAFGSYIYKTVRNLALNHVRDHRGKTVSLETVNMSLVDSAEEESGSENSDHLSGRFGAWIDELPPRQQEAFVLSRYEGLEHETIAGIMDISVKTVNNHIVEALKHLRKRYDAYKRS